LLVDFGPILVNKEFRETLNAGSKMSQTRSSAEAIALQILASLAGNEDILGIFQGSTGVSESDLRAGVHDPVFLGMVLDFVMMDDRWIVAACDASGLAYDSLPKARAALPGGAETHWT
jgi:hypothetical protein